MISFGHTVIYVENVKQVLEFYCEAFGFEISFLNKDGEYGELASGDTKLAFASLYVAKENFGKYYHPISLNEVPPGIELSFMVKDILASYERAIRSGASPITDPKSTPFGKIAYLRSIEGTLIRFMQMR